MTDEREADSPRDLIPSEATWALTILIFLSFFYYQRLLPVVGVVPLIGGRGDYTHSSLMIGILFFAPLLWFVPARHRNMIGGIWLTAAVLLFTIKYGIIDMMQPDWMFNNDRGDVLCWGWENMLMGMHPYDLSTPATSLTTSFILAFPGWALFGFPEWITVPLLGCGFGVLVWQRRMTGGYAPLPILAVLLFFNPVVTHELLWGSDLLWGSILLAAAAGYLQAGRPRMASLVFAFAICTRLIFFVFIPLWVIYVLRRNHTGGRWSKAIQGFVLAVIVIAVLELPFLIWNPKIFLGYAPVGVSSGKLAEAVASHNNLFSDLINMVLPEGMIRVVVLNALFVALSVLLGFRARTVAQLNLAIAALIAFMLFWMGKEFIVDYFAWLVMPLLMVVASWRHPRDAVPAS